MTVSVPVLAACVNDAVMAVSGSAQRLEMSLLPGVYRIWMHSLFCGLRVLYCIC